MPELRGLPNTSEVRECKIVRSVTQAAYWLSRGMAVVVADDYGAINVWDGDDGKFHCEAMRFHQTLDVQSFHTLKATRQWIELWMEKIASAALKGDGK